MNLYEKVGTTEPGKLAHLISDILYNDGEKLKGISCRIRWLDKPERDVHNALCVIRRFLEKLAHAELEIEAKSHKHAWLRELGEQQAKTNEAVKKTS